jgi:ATP-binding cassette subfamily B multidrug efflux pump
MTMRPPGARAEGESGWSGLDRELALSVLRFAGPHWVPLTIALALLPITAATQLVQPLIIKSAIDGPIAQQQASGLLPHAAGLLVALLLHFTLLFVQNWNSQIAGQRIVHDLRVAVHGHLLQLHSRYFLKHPAGRLLTRCTGDVEGIGEMFAAGLLTLISDLLLLVGICVALLLLNWRLALVTFAALPLLMAVSQWFQRNLRKTYRELRRRVSVLNAYLQERIAGIRIIQLFSREQRAFTEFEARNRELMNENFTSIRLDAMLFAFVDAMGHLVTALLVWWAAGPIVEGALTFGALVAFLDYVSRFFAPIRDLSQKVATLQSGLASAERVFELLAVDDRLEVLEDGHAPQAVAGAVTFQDVRFAYVPDEPVLRGLSLEVRAGERIALLGVTGAGKTTALRMINRIYEPDAGDVAIDGVNVRDWDLGALRGAVGVVLQDVVLFQGSVRENLTLGDGGVDDRVLIDAVGRVGAQGIVDRLGGLDAIIDERGTNLSAGERQLLAFARVLVYDPAILLLDEATSNVDTFSEEQIQAAIGEAMANRTTLVVAHRLSTIQQVDRIAVLHQGRLAEVGSHAELMALEGIYRKLYEAYFGGLEAA